jgi:hypothetical protein
LGTLNVSSGIINASNFMLYSTTDTSKNAWIDTIASSLNTQLVLGYYNASNVYLGGPKTQGIVIGSGASGGTTPTISVGGNLNLYTPIFPRYGTIALTTFDQIGYSLYSDDTTTNNPANGMGYAQKVYNNLPVGVYIISYSVASNTAGATGIFFESFIVLGSQPFTVGQGNEGYTNVYTGTKVYNVSSYIIIKPYTNGNRYSGSTTTYTDAVNKNIAVDVRIDINGYPNVIIYCSACLTRIA